LDYPWEERMEKLCPGPEWKTLGLRWRKDPEEPRPFPKRAICCSWAGRPGKWRKGQVGLFRAF